MQKDQVITEVEAFKEANGGNYSDYYIGITNDVARRIVEGYLTEHLNAGRYTADAPKRHWDCETRDKALEVEAHFHALGMRGKGPGGHGIEESKFVYCFKMDADNIRTYLNETVVAAEVSKMKHLMDFDTYTKKQ